MADINIVAVSGNLTRDPETKWTSDDGETSIVSFGVAVNKSRKVEGEYVDEVSFFDVDVFGGFANLIGRKLRKGDNATISGRLEQQRFEDKDGNARSAVRIIAQQIASPGLFRSKDEEGQTAPMEEKAAAPSKAAKAQEPKDDDIPF